MRENKNVRVYPKFGTAVYDKAGNCIGKGEVGGIFAVDIHDCAYKCRSINEACLYANLAYIVVLPTDEEKIHARRIQGELHDRGEVNIRITSEKEVSKDCLGHRAGRSDGKAEGDKAEDLAAQGKVPCCEEPALSAHPACDECNRLSPCDVTVFSCSQCATPCCLSACSEKDCPTVGLPERCPFSAAKISEWYLVK